MATSFQSFGSNQMSCMVHIQVSMTVQLNEMHKWNKCSGFIILYSIQSAFLISGDGSSFQGVQSFSLPRENVSTMINHFFNAKCIQNFDFF